ncbi:hypothetical protein HS088_TW04G01116 [Tripterygium wilfordii]|uniref:RWP-RK domain-containing protein n=1 Tax=Tripterygium wilfordii TaxID=458696 RepID=A0A7J7DS84_TRIWF|nr:hypothetical protein HS088_TW04G01116 [Tripterygium wilfordii]
MDPRGVVVPYNESCVINADVEYELINLLNTPDPNPRYLTSINQPNVPDPTPSIGFGIANANNNNHHPSDPMIWNSYKGSNHGTPLAIPEQSMINGGQSLLAKNPGIRKGVKLPKWPREPEPYHCDCCQVLRELIHTDVKCDKLLWWWQALLLPNSRFMEGWRERAKKMKLKDLKDVFHLPINKASEEVDLCPTVVKKICRREGLNRWPHRKIKSIEKQIENYKPMLASMHANERLEAEQEILKLEQEVADIMASAYT